MNIRKTDFFKATSFLLLSLKNTKQKPHKPLHGEVRFLEEKKNRKGKQVALHHDGRRDKTGLF